MSASEIEAGDVFTNGSDIFMFVKLTDKTFRIVWISHQAEGGLPAAYACRTSEHDFKKSEVATYEYLGNLKGILDFAGHYLWENRDKVDSSS